ncbi:hypothetical protein FACS189490_00370 [Clostridia bacterium]|nr:hypothetical protein FACS189490_00370 [Clostridia bacterium]
MGKLNVLDKNNLKDCAALFLDVFTAAPWSFSWLTKESVMRYFGDFLKTPNFQGFVYTQNGCAAGACAGIINDYFLQKVYDIKEIFVSPNNQRGGVGSAMLAEIEKVLAAEKVNAVTLSTQRDIPAYSFYLKNKYEESADTVFFWKPL